MDYEVSIKLLLIFEDLVKETKKMNKELEEMNTHLKKIENYVGAGL